ncbi:uncharacterized protein BDZ99DRAFT_514338 [Mytilinidion resinicola]|uniref:MEI5 protein n=1 Tax=Mytilinidion resinicola TaxID=574789 RepID=A0A6A6Z3G3_9PEZI|nr:uncharacterized protein BDZ99DRAFT_514338 [Mytilinidion resinicola]KAF2815691.1 hypothetical protein BDZ99DRAFT_514338 [Mytilinidion resinicola]
MSTAPKQTSAQAGSAINGITSISDSLRMAQDLKAAIESFASNVGFQTLSHLVDQIPQLREDIRAKDNQLKELHALLESQRDDHSTEQQKVLSIYEKRYDKYKEELGTLQGTIARLQTDIHDKEEKRAEIQTTLEVVKANGRKLESKHEAKISKLKEREHEITDLKTQVQESQAKATEFSKKLSESRDRVAKLEESLDKTRREHEGLKKEFEGTDGQLKELLNFSAPLDDRNLQTTANELENLWQSASSLIAKFLGKNLPDQMLQKHWGKLHENSIFKHEIPLPQSNSDIAKEMRIATVLGNLARLVNKHIFQSVYLLDESDGLHDLLRRQAVVENRKETFVRGILLSMFPEEQEEEAGKRIDWVVEDLTKEVGIRDVLTTDVVGTFERELEIFLAQAQRVWRSVQCSKQRLEPSFEYIPKPDLPWKTFEFQVADCKKEGKINSPVNTDRSEDELYTIFPRIYFMTDNVQPITAGTILKKAQLRTAAQEVQESAPNTPFAQLASARYRPRRSRTMSMSAESGRSGPVEKPFLSETVASAS